MTDIAAGNFAAGHIAGQAAAASIASSEPSTSLENISMDTLDARSEAVLGGAHMFSIERTLGGEMRLVLHLTENLFADFALGVLYVVLIASVTIAIAYAVAKGTQMGFGACGFRMSCIRFSQTVMTATLLFAGFTLAYGSVGVSFTTILFGAGFVAAAFVVATSQMSMDFFDGLRLTSWNLLEDHHKINADHLALEGEMISLGYFTSEIRRSTYPDTPEPDNGATYRSKTTLVRNSLLLGGPLDVWWHIVRETERPVVRDEKPTIVAKEQGPYNSTRFPNRDYSAQDIEQAIMMASTNQSASTGNRPPYKSESAHQGLVRRGASMSLNLS